MHIVVLGTKGIPNVIGGVEKHAEEVYPRMVALGHKVTIFRRKRKGVSQEKEYKGVNIIDIRIPQFPIVDIILYNFIGFFRAVFLKPDVLHIHCAGPSVFALPARIFGLKVLYTAHCFLERKSFRNGIARFAERVGIKFAHKVIVVAQHISDSFSERYHFSKALHIPNGISMESDSATNCLLKEPEGFENKKYVIAVGRFVPIKGFHLLFDAVSVLEKYNFKIVLAGDAIEETEYSINLKKKAEEKGIILTGYITGNKLKELYRNASLFLQTSFQEGNPLALLDAIGAGVDVLVSDLPGNRELGISEDSMFKCGDSEDFCEKLEKKLSSVEKHTVSPEILEFYNWDEIARKLDAEIRKTVSL